MLPSGVTSVSAFHMQGNKYSVRFPCNITLAVSIAVIAVSAVAVVRIRYNKTTAALEGGP